MNIKTKLVVIALLFLALPQIGLSQIIYSDGKLNINLAENPYGYSMAADNWTGLYWTQDNKKTFKIDISGEQTSLSGANNHISFYDPHVDDYNAIEVGKVKSYSWNKEMSAIKALNKGLDKVMELKPILFTIEKQYGVMPTGVTIDSIIGPIKGDGTKDPFPAKMIVGFNSAELETVLPDVVTNDNNGHDFIDYSSIIPYLVSAIQELKQTVDEQTELIKELTTGSGSQNVRNRVNGRIAQCSPNPTPGLISVYLEIDESATSVELRVSSVSGNVELSQAITPDEKYVDMDLSHLTSGLHVLSLYIDGILADSTQIIKE